MTEIIVALPSYIKEEYAIEAENCLGLTLVNAQECEM